MAQFEPKKSCQSLLRYLARNGWMSILPDKLFLKIAYWSWMGKRLNLNDPQTFNEKLQWLKIHDQDPLHTQLVDKYDVRAYIECTIGAEYLIPLLGVWDHVEDIPWSTLPDQFVIKCTHASGANIICSDKSKLDIQNSKAKLERWLKKSWYSFGREWPYKNVKPRLMAEQFMIDEESNELKDFKFMCFNGEPKCVLVCSDRHGDSGLKMDFYDEIWNQLSFTREYPNSGIVLPMPKLFDKMIELASKLSQGSKFLRVDFYEVNGKLYFGELTFYPSSGFVGFQPEHFDLQFGKMISLNDKG